MGLGDSTGVSGGGRFATTRWSLVFSAGEDDVQRQDALGELCELYWYPLYAYARRRGEDRHAAEDLTQGFLTRLLEKGDLAMADPARGRFRSFLLAAMKNFMSGEWRKEHTIKRGGEARLVSLDVDLAEGRLELEDRERTPDEGFDRDWALALLDAVLLRLRAEYVERGREQHFDGLKPYLMGEGQLIGGSYAETAEKLGTSEGSIKVAVHRLRTRFRDELRREVAETVEGPEAVEDELQALLAALQS